MKITIIVKEEHLKILNDAITGKIDFEDKDFNVDWSNYSNYVKGFITVQLTYENYIKLNDSSS